MGFPEYATRVGYVLESLSLPGTLPYSLVEAQQVTTIFQDLVPIDTAEVQGFGLANGDSLVLFGVTVVSSHSEEQTRQDAERELMEAFTAQYGGDGRLVIARFEPSFSYLIASKDWAEHLDIIARETRHAPTVSDVVSRIQNDPSLDKKD